MLKGTVSRRLGVSYRPTQEDAKTDEGVVGYSKKFSRQSAHPSEVGEAPPDHFLLAHVFTLAGAISMGAIGEEIGAAPVAPTKSRSVEAFCARSGRPHSLGGASYL